MFKNSDAVTKANRVLHDFGERNPEKIAKLADILILPQPFKHQKGAYTIIERQPVIFIKEDMHPVTKQIVIGHELGHHYLHRSEISNSHIFKEFNIFDMRDNRMEYEANLFASQIMLPDDEVLEYIHNGMDISQIAKAMLSDINLVALKVAEMNRRGYSFREQEHDPKFLKSTGSSLK